MKRLSLKLVLLMTLGAAPFAVQADPALECDAHNDTQIEVRDCVAAAEVQVDAAVKKAYGFAMTSAKELDQVTGRKVSAKALEASQAAWSTYRDTHCTYVGSTLGGGSGTGIAITGCRIILGRARVARLMQTSQ